MNGFKEASVHELESILRLVDTQALNGDNLTFMIDWTTEGTSANKKYSANIVIFYLESLGDR